MKSMLPHFTCDERQPGPELRPLVRRFLVVQFPRDCEDSHLPDTDPVIAISVQGACRIDEALWAPKAAVTGLRETLRRHRHCDENALLLATCTPAGLSALVGAPMGELQGQTVNLVDVLNAPRAVESLHDELATTSDWNNRVTIFERFLRFHARSLNPDPLVEAVAEYIKGLGRARMTDLARYTGLSQSALERRFRRIVGISPKKFAGIVQLREAVRLKEGGANWAGAALQAGYYDQSHLINAFRRATGHAPTRIKRSLREPANADFFQDRPVQSPVDSGNE